MGNGHGVDVADLRARKPGGLVGAHARAHKAGLMTADDVVGERRAVGIGIHDLAVGHKAELDERLEAVAHAEHQSVALFEEVRDLLLDRGVAEERRDELGTAVGLVAAGEAAGDDDDLAILDGLGKVLDAVSNVGAR